MENNITNNNSLSKFRGKVWRKFFLLLIAFIGICGCTMAIFINGYFKDKTGFTIRDCYMEGKDSVKDSKPSDFKSDKATNIYSSNGTKIATIYKNKESSYLSYDEIPKNAVNAFIAVEDRTFWENSGIDLKGIIRVMYNYIKTGGNEAHGASTITQQLARQTYLSLEKTLTRKVSEIAAAQELSKLYSKEEIMEFYVNICCYSNGIYGLQDASLRYFGINAKDLSLSQTAYLCAIPNWPEKYNPLKNPDAAIPRRNKILKDMLELGYISQQEYTDAINETINIVDYKEKEQWHEYETTYAIHCATEYLMQLSGFEFEYDWNDMQDYENYQSLYSKAYEDAKNDLYTGGYEIYTSIDLKLQQEMQETLNTELETLSDENEDGSFKVQGAMTVIDNKKGKVVAVIGGRRTDNDKDMFVFNRTFQGYAQPGSSIKPIAVYAPAMETNDNGITTEEQELFSTFTPDSVLYNIDVSSAKTASEGEISAMSGNPVYLRSAVERSLNGCAYWLLNNIGINRGLSHLSNMQFSKIVPSDYNLSASLGGLTYGVTTNEMANAYYTLENGGMYHKTECIVSILDKDGNEIYENPEPYRVYDRNAAYAMTDIMKGVLKSGTASKSRWYNNHDTEAAGKTGTTNDNKAAWFCGYTPYYTASVWVGCDTPEEVPNLMGSNYPLNIWVSSMEKLIDSKPDAKFAEMPDMEESIVMCVCGQKCKWGKINQDCKVCNHTSNQTELDEVCRGMNSSCVCPYKCEGDSLNEGCPVCVSNPDLCAGVNRNTVCSCTTSCSPGNINTACLRCRRNWTICNHYQPSCICERNCIDYGLNMGCPVCSTDANSCTGAR